MFPTLDQFIMVGRTGGPGGYGPPVKILAVLEKPTGTLALKAAP
jgi:hypothetical protein